ncbi:hypothetical protein [Salinicoccus roseus]|uniref:hypothetical protein n=1 Tax=Salinicoccus roseus TaxID=45670 RepID=UPI0023010DBF|nr:hypothetical protein [Salinicoccus roseus]
MKNLLSLPLMTLMLLMLAGCGGNEDGAEDAMPEVEDESTEEVTTEESAAGGTGNNEDNEASTEESQEETTEESASESGTSEPSTEEGAMGGASASGPYEQNMVQNPAGEQCIMNRLAAEHCDGITMQEKFLAYHHLTFTNELPISPNIGCLECMVDYSFAVMDGNQEPISKNEVDQKGVPFTPELETFMESYAYELANFFNGHPSALLEYLDREGPAMMYIHNNRLSGNFADHTTHSVDVQNIEDMGDGTYKVTMYREYEHVTSNGIGSGTVEYTVNETPHAFEIVTFQAVDTASDDGSDDASTGGSGGGVSGPYEQDFVQNPAAVDCILSHLATEECEGFTMQEKFLAYHHLNFTNELPISPNIGCLECMVDYSFAVMDGSQEAIGIEEMDAKGAPFTPDLDTFMESYAYELANFFNGHQNRLMDYIGQGSPAMSYLDNNRASGNFADHTTHSVDVKNIEDMGDGTYKITMYREYEHVSSNSVGSGTVEYTVQETPHAFEIVNFKAVSGAPDDSSGGGPADGAAVSGPYGHGIVQDPAAEDCIMNRLSGTDCDSYTMQEKFLAYHQLALTNALPTSPNVGCLECMVDYSFAVQDGSQEPIGRDEMDAKGAPFTPDLETFMESYGYELANFFNGDPHRLADYIDMAGPANTYLTTNRASGNFTDHTTHAVDVQDIEEMGDGTYKVTMYREYEHITSNGIGSGTVEYTVRETRHAFKIVDFMAVGS